MARKVFNSYDPDAAFPQGAALGLGVIDEKGEHTAPPGLTGHEVTSEIMHGADNEFYDTTAPDTLTPKTQAEVDAIIAARAVAQQAKTDADIANREKIKNDKGQVGGLPETNARIDDLVELLQTQGIVPR